MTVPGQQGGGPGGRDSVRESIVIGIGLVLGVLIFWYTSHEAIARAVMIVRGWETHLVPFDPLAQSVVRQWIAQTHPKDVPLGQLVLSGEILGRVLSYVSAGILAALGLFLIYRSPDFPGRFTNRYTMASLAKQESALWKTITPVLDADLLNVPLDDPVQGMRQTPRAYARRLSMVVAASSLKELPQDAEIINGREVLLLNRTRAVFRKQVGKRWQGIDSLQPHEKALFAAFAAQANHAATAAQELIDELPQAYMRAVKKKNAKLITSPRVAKLLAAHGSTPVVTEVLRKHKYVRSVLMAMLVAARVNGVLPPGWFRWLKTVDRITWYALNDLGTENASAEAAGVRSHYNAERLLGSDMDEPEVEAAIDGLREYLHEVLDEAPEEI